MPEPERWRPGERLSASKLARRSLRIQGARSMRGDGFIHVARTGDVLTLSLDVETLLPFVIGRG